MANAEHNTTLSRRQFSSAAAFAVFVAVKAVPSLAEVRQRGAYLAEHLVRNDLAPEQFDALLASLAA